MRDEKQIIGTQHSAMTMDVDRFLEAIQAGNAGEIQESMAHGPQPKLNVEPRLLHRGTELADTFEMEIGDCRSCEVHR